MFERNYPLPELSGSFVMLYLQRRMATSNRSFISLHILLGLIALASVLFHIRSVEQIFPQWFGIVRAEWPFLLEAEDKPHFRLDYLQENAPTAGLRRKDELIAINGIPIESRSAFADLLSNSKPGSVWDVLYRRQAQASYRHASFSLRKAETRK